MLEIHLRYFGILVFEVDSDKSRDYFGIGNVDKIETKIEGSG